jgi:hypothetical protein
MSAYGNPSERVRYSPMMKGGRLSYNTILLNSYVMYRHWMKLLK